MTRAQVHLLLLLAAVIAATGPVVGGLRLRGAREELIAAEARLELVTAEAARVVLLRSQWQTVAAGEPPQQDVFRRATEALHAAGLTRARVQSVNAAGDRALDSGGAGQRVQSVRIVLEPLSLDELGDFLAAWARDQRLWTTTAVELQATGGSASRDGVYRVTLTASAVYVSARGAESLPEANQS